MSPVNGCLAYLYDTTGKSQTTFKSITEVHYFSGDSLFLHKRLDYKLLRTYNNVGEEIMSKQTNANGKTTDSTILVYDKNNNKLRVTKYTLAYGTPEKMYIQSDEVLIRDISGHLLSDITSGFDSPEVSANKSGMSINKICFAYDGQGNKTMEIIIHGSDTTSMTKKGYDAKNRMISETSYEQGKLKSVRSRVYNKSDGYAETVQNITDNIGPSCPNDSKTVTTYDKNGVPLSSTETKERQGKTYTAQTTYQRKYSKGKLLSEIITTTEKGDGYESRDEESTLYQYDIKGNLLQLTNKGGGIYGDNSKIFYEYNDKNKPTKKTEYGSCTSKPETTTLYSYYADGVNIKETTEITDNSKTIKHYDETGKIAEETGIGKYVSYQQTIYQYENR